MAYTLARGRFGVLASLDLGGLTRGRRGDRLPRAARRRLRPAAPRSLPARRGFLFAVSLGSWLAGLPFSLYATFSIEARFGFNRTTPEDLRARHAEEPGRVRRDRPARAARLVLVHGSGGPVVVGVGVPRAHGLRAGDDIALPPRDRAALQQIHTAARRDAPRPDHGPRRPARHSARAASS